MKKIWKIFGDVLGGIFVGLFIGSLGFLLNIFIYNQLRPEKHGGRISVQELNLMGASALITFIIIAIIASIANYKLFKVKPLWLAILTATIGALIVLSFSL